MHAFPREKEGSVGYEEEGEVKGMQVTERVRGRKEGERNGVIKLGRKHEIVNREGITIRTTTVW